MKSESTLRVQSEKPPAYAGRSQDRRPERLAKSGPAYLHSKDLPDEVADPTGQVEPKFQVTWDEVRQAHLSTYCPQRTGVLLDQYRANGWY